MAPTPRPGTKASWTRSIEMSFNRAASACGQWWLGAVDGEAVGDQRVDRPASHDLARLEHVPGVRHVLQPERVLLGHEHRHSQSRQLGDLVEDLAGDGGGQLTGGLVEE